MTLSSLDALLAETLTAYLTAMTPPSLPEYAAKELTEEIWPIVQSAIREKDDEIAGLQLANDTQSAELSRLRAVLEGHRTQLIKARDEAAYATRQYARDSIAWTSATFRQDMYQSLLDHLASLDVPQEQ